mmetsp:Transcript_109204/g.308931  ORF Transcript_109204/g.308931 Transcript_109204/m.308931 type:complete len:288 (-) Transcript_109204:96-959(-)
MGRERGGPALGRLERQRRELVAPGRGQGHLPGAPPCGAARSRLRERHTAVVRRPGLLQHGAARCSGDGPPEPPCRPGGAAVARGGGGEPRRLRAARPGMPGAGAREGHPRRACAGELPPPRVVCRGERLRPERAAGPRGHRPLQRAPGDRGAEPRHRLPSDPPGQPGSQRRGCHAWGGKVQARGGDGGAGVHPQRALLRGGARHPRRRPPGAGGGHARRVRGAAQPDAVLRLRPVRHARLARHWGGPRPVQAEPEKPEPKVTATAPAEPEKPTWPRAKHLSTPAGCR